MNNFLKILFPTSIVAALGLVLAQIHGPAWLMSLQNLQYTRAQTNTSGDYTWTFPTPYDAGVTPRIVAVTELNTTDIMNVNLTSLSNTSVTVHCTRTTPLVVLAINVLGVSSSPQCFVHLYADSP